MSLIMNLFSRRMVANGSTWQSVQRGETSSGRSGDEVVLDRDIQAFERLGENQQSVDRLVNEVIHGLSAVGALSEQMSSLKAALIYAFDEHRNLALENSSIKQELEYTAQRLTEKINENNIIHNELQVLKPELDEVRRSHEITKTHNEALEHRHHLLGLAKKEVEELLSRNVAMLALTQEECDSLRLEISASQETSEHFSMRLTEITSKYNEVNDNSVLLMRKNESFEMALQSKTDELFGLKERFEVLCQEKDAAILYGQQKEQESAHFRTEMAKLVQQAQQERKARELEISQLRADYDSVRAQSRMMEEINSQTRIENEQLSLQSRRAEDQSAQLEAAVKHLESKVARLTSKLESVANAKDQVEQSRATMSARIEALTQALSEREGDAKRLEMEVARMVAQIDKQAEASQDSIDALNARNLELEKEISAQRKETAYYASQLNALQKTESRASM